MITRVIRTNKNDSLCHHGVKGQRWGVRRYQEEDGDRTALGKRHERTLAKNEKSGTGKKVAKTVGLLAGGAAIGAAAVGSAWLIKNRQVMMKKKAAILKREQTKSMRRAMGLYNKVKGSYVDPVSGMIVTATTTAQQLAKMVKPG